MTPQHDDKPPREPYRRMANWVYHRPGGGRGGAAGGVPEPRNPRPGTGSAAAELKPPRS
jgi:hypothetical protein